MHGKQKEDTPNPGKERLPEAGLEYIHTELKHQLSVRKALPISQTGQEYKREKFRYGGSCL